MVPHERQRYAAHGQHCVNRGAQRLWRIEWRRHVFQALALALDVNAVVSVYLAAMACASLAALVVAGGGLLFGGGTLLWKRANKKW